LSVPQRVELWGRDESEFGMSNPDFDTLTNGEVPTYYRVIYEGEAGDGRARIAYWWFYGWQPPCNNMCIPFYSGSDGTHHGDWEHIVVTTSPDRSQIDYVTYFFHASSYTRPRGTFDTEGERPVVYVGKLGHGSYHSQDCSGYFPSGPTACCEFTDYRDPHSDTWWSTEKNLVSLDRNAEEWMLADRSNDNYNYRGQEYTIVQWKWGPSCRYCRSSILCLGDCVDWEVTDAIETHPTVHSLDWGLPACSDKGCGAYDGGCAYICDYKHNETENIEWPWD